MTPLDELIEDLERALPVPSTQVDASMSFVDLQHYVSVALYGTEEDQARAEREPWYQRVEKHLAEMAERQQRDAATQDRRNVE